MVFMSFLLLAKCVFLDILAVQTFARPFSCNVHDAKHRSVYLQVAFTSMPIHCMLALSLRVMARLRSIRYKKDAKEDPFKKSKSS